MLHFAFLRHFARFIYRAASLLTSKKKSFFQSSRGRHVAILHSTEIHIVLTIGNTKFKKHKSGSCLEHNTQAKFLKSLSLDLNVIRMGVHTYLHYGTDTSRSFLKEGYGNKDPLRTV